MTRFDTIFRALEESGVRYVVVGGIAVNLHGYQRFTKDVDIVIELIPDKTLKALKALQSVGYSPRLPVALADFANPDIRKSWIRDKGMLVFQLYNEQIHQTVDIFADYPIDFEQLCRDAVPIQLGSASPKIASIDHLIVMKQGAGRPQDLVDIEMLNKLKVLIAERDKT